MRVRWRWGLIAPVAGVALLACDVNLSDADAGCPPNMLACPPDPPRTDGSIDGGPADCVPSPESCNGRDDDCDERIDEDVAPVPTECGEGSCSAKGSSSCDHGTWVDDCSPGVPTEEVCDTVDNDCDGAVDEIEGGPCYQGPEGTLVNPESAICREGRWGCDAKGRMVCIGQVLPRIEVMSRGLEWVDDDCDGQVDEMDIGWPSCSGDGDEPCPPGNSFSRSIDDLPENQPVDVVVRLKRPDALPEGDAEVEDIVFRQGQVIDEVTELVGARAGFFQIQRRFSHIYAFTAQADPVALRALWRQPLVGSIMYDAPIEPSMAEVDALIGASGARRSGGVNGRGTRIAFVDSGIDYRHPTFGACGQVGEAGCRVVDGYDLLDDDDDPLDDLGHGTAIAAAAAGQAVDVESAGVAPGAELIALRIGSAGRGRIGHMYSAVDWLLANPDPLLKVVNFGYTTNELWFAPNCADAFDNLAPRIGQLVENGLLVTAPTGNHGVPLAVTFPACLPGVVGVGAVYDGPQMEIAYPNCVDPRPENILGRIDEDVVTCFSNGVVAPNTLISLLAPGAMIRSAWLTENGEARYREGYGTSFSSALTAGAAALLFQARPWETAAEVENRLLTTAVAVPQIFDPIRINVGRLFLWAALDRDCPDEDGDGVGARGEDCGEIVDCDDADPLTGPGFFETCDGQDNDCDGSIDEGYGIGDRCEVGAGACLAVGEWVCGDGVAVCSATEGVAVPEVCNGIDDDCDGTVDETFRVGQPCVEGVGVCEGQGEWICDDAGGEVCTARADPGQRRDEDVPGNNQDDDCNGIVDDCRHVDIDHPNQIRGCNSEPIPSDYDDYPQGVDNCLRHNDEECSRERLEAWCHRRESELESRWVRLHEQWVVDRDPDCLRADTRRDPDGRKRSYCVEWRHAMCDGSQLRRLTPLALKFGPFGEGPAYTRGTGRFDLGREQDGSGNTHLWITDGFLVRMPTSGEALTGRHLFGEATLDADGKPTFLDGWAALKVVDVTGAKDGGPDGWLTHDTGELEGIGLWTDSDADREVDPGEIASLAKLGVIAIRVEPFIRDREAYHPSGMGYVEGRGDFAYRDEADGSLRFGSLFDVYLR